jgi:DNA-directed RNA polymerase subunit omega
MIEALKGEEIVRLAGGRFKLTALIQHRLRDLMDGARPLVERRGRSDLEIVIQEVAEGKITLEMEREPSKKAVKDDSDE